MSDLIGFVNARLDEDEAAAMATAPSGKRLAWRPDPTEPEDPADGPAILEYVISDPNPSGVCLALGLERGSGHEVAEHIARHDPARVLREVAAKRAILDEHAIHSEPEIVEHRDKFGPNWNDVRIWREETGRLSWWCDVCDDDRDYGHIGGPDEGCPTLRALAAVWSDHPDYDRAWALAQDAPGAQGAHRAGTP